MYVGLWVFWASFIYSLITQGMHNIKQ